MAVGIIRPYQKIINNILIPQQVNFQSHYDKMVMLSHNRLVPAANASPK